MSNVTLAIDDALLKQARIKALKDGTSVNEICRRAIEQYVGRDADVERRIARLRASVASAQLRPPGSPPAWQGREALYAERMEELERRRRK
jgi:hypothetical protein